MLGNQPFYHRSIRKYVALFGSIFNDIFIVRETHDRLKRERIKVPIRYSPKEKFMSVLRADPTLTKSTQITLPRISFEMVSLEYDATRKQQSTIRHRVEHPLNAGSVISQYMGVPYNFDFVLTLYVRNIEDGLQVVEQVLPFFVPDYTVSARISDEVNITKDIPIVLTSVAENIEYEGALQDGTRMITWDFNFTLKGFLFGPTSNSSIIMGTPNTISANANTANGGNGNTFVVGSNVNGGIYINMYRDVNNKLVQKVKVTGGFINFRETERVRDPDRGLLGTVHYWDNVSNTLYVTDVNGVLSQNANIWGLETGAHWVVQSLETVNQKDVEIRIYQSPITAGPNDDYGYTEIIKEFPDTL